MEREGADAMGELNFLAAWVAILIGLITGTGMGLFFHDADWMGGYGSWRRRMMRLGHISFFGTGFLNLAFVLSLDHLGRAEPPPWPWPLASAGFLLGAATMPVVCFLAAWRPPLRHLFFIPVASLIVATMDFLLRGLWR
jgi:hypothetical protein